MVYLEKVKARVQELHLIVQNMLWACSEEEVEQMEQWLHLRLPIAYREFLLWAGHRAGYLFDEGYFYWNIERNQSLVREMLGEDHFPEPLPEDAFVIRVEQAYLFDFVRLSEGEDPPVYHYLEGMKHGPFPCIAPHFSDYLLKRVEEHASYLKQLEEREKHISRKHMEWKGKVLSILDSGDRSWVRFQNGADDPGVIAFAPHDAASQELLEFVQNDGQTVHYPLSQTIAKAETGRLLSYFIRTGEKAPWISWREWT